MGREKINVLLYDNEGYFLQECESLSECASLIKSAQSHISHAITGKMLSVNGFQIRQKTDRYPLRIGDLSGERAHTFVIGKYWNGKLVTVYKSIKQASEITGISSGNISGAISKGYRCKGFEFKKII